MTSDELPLHVETLGLEPGADVETFLLIHGYAGSTFSWRYWAPRLARRGHVVMVDMKGFGRAPKPDDGRYGPEHQAELVRRLISARDLRQLTICGHSLGGGVALLASLWLLDDEDDRLQRLVIVSGAAYDQKLPPFVRLAGFPRVSTLAFKALGARRIVRVVLQSIVHDRASVTEDQVRGYAAPLESSETVRTLLRTAQQIMPQGLGEITSRYPELDVPALLLWGAHDRVVPPWVGERLERELPRARLHVLPKCGHLPAEELPDASWEVLEGFLGATERPGRV